VTVVRVSAPGKLFLLGEYAVLEGAPALLAAVERRATATATTSARWVLTAHELGIDGLALGPDGSLPPGIDPKTHGRLALVDAVRAGVAALPSALPGAYPEPLDLAIDTSALHENGHKLGLGSSAAVATALTAALANARGIGLTREKLFSLADAAHRAAQGGAGSGGDVAASVYGGLLLYTRGTEPVPATWPADLELFAVVTGAGSSTTALVARVADYREREPRGYRRDLAALSTLAREAESALAEADAFLALADEYFLALDALGAHSGAGIVTERHRELRDLAAASGAVFKPTGAGGGDLGLVFAKLEATDRLRSAFTEAGAAVIPVPFSPDGAKIDAARIDPA
jgi:phosphomevalonate kinase